MCATAPTCAPCSIRRASPSKIANCSSSARSWRAASRAPSSAAVPWRSPCCAIWRPCSAISTDNTISSFCFPRTRSATCSTRLPRPRGLLGAHRRHLRRLEGRRHSARNAGAHRAGKTAPAGPLGIPAQGDRKRRARSRARTTRSTPSAVSCRTCGRLAGKRRHRLRRALRFARSRRSPRCAWPPSASTSCAASILARQACASTFKAADLGPSRKSSYGLRDYLSGLEANPGRLEEIETAWPPSTSSSASTASPSPKCWLSWTRSARRSPPWSTPASAWRSCGKAQAPGRASSRKLAADLTAAALAGRAQARKTRGGGTGAASHGAHRVPRGDRPGRLVRARRRPRRVPGLAQPGRRAARPGQGGFRWRDLAHSRWPSRRVSRGPRPLLSAPWFSTKWTPAWAAAPPRAWAGVEETGCRQSGLVRDPPAADRLLRRPSLPRGEAGIQRPHRGRRSRNWTAARTREVGRMLSGQKLTPEALKNAERLIKSAV